MINQHTESDIRAKAIKDLLHDFTLCESVIFDCRDASLQPGHFVEICPLDIKPVINSNDQQEQINEFLRARAKINLRLKIAESMLRKLKSLPKA